MTELYPHHIPPQDNIYDVTFIGAGPSGLFGAYYAGYRGMSCKIIDSLEQAGGQLTAKYPEKWIKDAPGYPKILAKDLVRRLLEQANHYNPKLCLSETIETLNINKTDNLLELGSEKGIHKTRTLIISAGLGPTLYTKPGNKEIEKYEGKGLFYSVKEKNRFHNKKLLIMGGGDSAVDWALDLEHYAKEITLIHRHDNWKAQDANIAELFKSSINVQTWHELRAIEGRDRVERAIIFGTRTKQKITLEVDYVLCFLGSKPNLEPLKKWGIDFTEEFAKDGKLLEKKYLKVNSRQETNIPGVYAIGDIARNPEVEPLGLIAVGFGEAPYAVAYADLYINPGKKFQLIHSSETRLPH